MSRSSKSKRVGPREAISSWVSVFSAWARLTSAGAGFEAATVPWGVGAVLWSALCLAGAAWAGAAWVLVFALVDFWSSARAFDAPSESAAALAKKTTRYNRWGGTTAISAN